MSKPRQRSPRPTTLSEKDNGKSTSTLAAASQTSVPRPALDDRDAWKAYWAARGQPWRTEPEIDQKRQRELAQRRAIVPDIAKGTYPFRKMKLSRADVEWLLATHENGRGPVNWSDEHQRERKGLDLRGANLRQEDLHGLPLARLRGGLNGNEHAEASPEQRKLAALHLENANFFSAYLEGAYLAHAHLESANLSRAHLEGADFYTAHLEGTYLRDAHLEGASLRGAFLDAATNLTDVFLGNEACGFAFLAHVRWNEANLSVVNWAQVKKLGDDHEAKQPNMWYGQVKNRNDQLRGYQRSVWANRQLAVVLQSQGLNEEGTRFAYRAQVLQKHVLWFQITQPKAKLKRRMQALRAWLFSWFLFIIAGYGYKPGRSFLAYFLVITGFATAYYLLGHTVGPALSPLGAFVFSMTSFHGRGFFPGGIKLDDPLTVLAAIEALVGLIIEVTFIATLTQRFFNR